MTETGDLLQFTIILALYDCVVQFIFVFWYDKIYLTTCIQSTFFLKKFFLKGKDELGDSCTMDGRDGNISYIEIKMEKEKREKELKMLGSGFVSTDI